VLSYAAAQGDDQIRNQQMSRINSELKPQTGLFGSPPRYYDQNLALFGIGWMERQFWFDSNGALKVRWQD
jgi:endoglucanase